VDQCLGSILAPGITKQSCSSHSWPITSEMLHSPNATWGPGKDRYANHTSSPLPLFTVDVIRNYEQVSEAAIATVGYASWHNWEGSFTETKCTLVPAVMEYDVSIDGGIVTLAYDSTKIFPPVAELANNTKPMSLSPQAQELPQNETMGSITAGVAALSNSDTRAIWASGVEQWQWDSNTYNLFTCESCITL
jgi:hypothetical protein